MTSTKDALLRAAYADPFDDTPRLVLADCIQEAGNEDGAEWLRWMADNKSNPMPSPSGKTFWWWRFEDGFYWREIQEWDVPTELFHRLSCVPTKVGYATRALYRTRERALCDLTRACLLVQPPKQRDPRPPGEG